MKATVQPCPFCGSRDIEFQYQQDDESPEYAHSSNWNLICNAAKSGCGGQSGYAQTPEGAVAKWNRRHDNNEIIVDTDTATRARCCG